MASLYNTTGRVRNFLFWAIVIVIVILVADFVIKFWQSSLNPFTQIPSFYEQPSNLINSGLPTSTIKPPSLEIADNSSPAFTIEGAFPSLPDTARLYKIERPRERLDTLSTATNTASRMGFANFIETSTEGLQWTNSAQTKSLTFNRVKQVWQLRTQYFLDQQALAVKNLLPEESAYNTSVLSMLNSLNLSDSSIQNGLAVSKFSRLGNDGLFTNPLVGNQANYITSTVYRKLPLARLLPQSSRSPILESLPEPKEFDGLVYSTDPKFGSVKMVVSDRATSPSTDLYELDITNYEVNTNNYTIEFILTPAEAWTQVQQGNGSLMQLKPQGSDYFAASQKLQVTRFALDAKNVELGYWEPAEWEGFFYPIFIFRGRADLADGKTADFVFYMDALKRVQVPVVN